MEIFKGSVEMAFALTLFAGLSTGIGSVIGLFAHHTHKKFLSVSLGFSAGVMIYVSFVEILGKAREYLMASLGEVNGNWIAYLAFFSGIALIGIIDRMIPSYENPHEMREVVEAGSDGIPAVDLKKIKLMRTGLLVAMALAIHNFPEGLATFMAVLHDPSLGFAIAIAIAIHNIPEGISVSVPIYFATKNRKKAFWYSFFSGMAEPLGALVGYFVLRPFFSDVVFGFLFAAVGGIMVYISLDELLPAAREYGEHHLSIYGLIAGMAVMGASLLLFI
ncbi:MAG: zinc transporter ZupT [Bacteriovoracia bacterium]